MQKPNHLPTFGHPVRSKMMRLLSAPVLAAAYVVKSARQNVSSSINVMVATRSIPHISIRKKKPASCVINAWKFARQHHCRKYPEKKLTWAFHKLTALPATPGLIAASVVPVWLFVHWVTKQSVSKCGTSTSRLFMMPVWVVVYV